LEAALKRRYRSSFPLERTSQNSVKAKFAELLF
jgi:hypothetical protein